VTVKVEIKGIDKLVPQLQRLGKAGEDAAVAAIAEMGHDIAKEATRRVPVVTGILRGSLLLDTRKPKDLRLEYHAPYAVFVHERPEGRGYKWLARSVAAVLGASLEKARGRIRRAVQTLRADAYRAPANPAPKGGGSGGGGLAFLKRIKKKR